MTVRKRGNRWQCDFAVSDGKGGLLRFRRSLGRDVSTRRQAEQSEARLRATVEREVADLVRGDKPGDLPKAAFSGFASHWLEVHVEPNC
jgi:hypothetical protein